MVTAFVGLRLLGRAAAARSSPASRSQWSEERPSAATSPAASSSASAGAIADACPGPIAAQLGQGIWWSAFTIAGVFLGVYFFLRREEETEPAAEPQVTAASAA